MPGSDKYQFDKLLASLDWEPNSWSPTRETSVLLIRLIVLAGLCGDMATTHAISKMGEVVGSNPALDEGFLIFITPNETTYPGSLIGRFHDIMESGTRVPIKSSGNDLSTSATLSILELLVKKCAIKKKFNRNI